jgi:hypothetical protein
MEQSPRSEVYSHSVKKFHPFYEPEGCYRVHKNPPLVPIRNQLNPLHTLTLYFLNISAF